uniref:NADH-ubiquinone oxidoreductase chain 5 n=1 Tax=Panaorus albomaculatus TaxID=300813 RepID=A0A1C9J9X0_9HEMI|nr:NADH dehydrogenase subunit 5 [Panaorus albomaculatus]AOP18554.1 NADH dehydrogenase subunit 5 [Panaorus albomaculatus]
MYLNMYMLWFIIFFISGLILYLMGMLFILYSYSVLIDWEIINLNSCSLSMTFLFDWMSLFFIGSVMFISCMVIFYSFSYMSGDKYKFRFLFLVIMFVISMCMMIISPNLVSILLGWDGLGLVSYCLVIYFHNCKSYNAGMLTILTNRIGDVAILLSIGYMYNLGSWYFMFYNYNLYSWGFIYMCLIILASFTKSAQIPFSSWLPAAMAAPTPVSALVHSSTLVTAGVYLLIRFNSLFNFNMNLFLMVSVLTMFMSGLGANYEYDMKKIIALSTLSQLGLMMSILFMGYSDVAFFHLLTHAFFKALLFLCSGLIIHCMNDTQDIRYMGGLINNLPYTSVCFSISNLSLCGLPFLSGFYSKDLILELMNMNMYNLYLYLLFYISIGLTASYSLRLIYYSMINYIGLLSYNNYYEDYKMMNSLIFLTFMSVIKGGLLSWMIFPIPNMILLPLYLKCLALFFMVLGGFVGYYMSLMKYSNLIFGLNFNFISEFLGSMWFMPSFSTYMLYSFSLSTSLNYVSILDYSWGEYMMSNLLINYNLLLSSVNFIVQLNSIKVFFLIFMLYSLFFFFI